ncbi:MAG: DUF721 domain-containing protein [Candidatus Goldbacteria bacterium]|nr:DUF721 domain-containing protein [Candidatus Goldiibacteriota bacterium]
MQHIKDIIEKLIKKTKFKELNETNFILENWEEIVGKDIADNTFPVKLYKHTLFINVKNSVIMEEMIYKKNELIEKINSVFKEKKIKNIIFKI